jgi:hypothetical protein
MKNVQVFGIATQMVELGSNELLSRVISFVSTNHLALDVEMHMDTYGHDDCGHVPYIESYVASGTVGRNMERLRKLGADVRFVTMDEPLWFGNEYNGSHNACHDSVDEIARRVAVNVAEVKRVFPNAEIGDVEPFTGTRPNWVSTMLKWLDAYRGVTGAYPAYIHADVLWSNGASLPQLYEIARHLRGTTVRFGVIYDGDAADNSGLEFNTRAQARYRKLEQALGWRPDAIFMSWMYAPEHILPESDSGSLTNLLRSYVEWRAKYQR